MKTILSIIGVIIVVFASSCGGEESTPAQPESLRAATTISIADNSNNGNASDLSVSFTASTPDDLLDSYKLILTKAASPITLEQALATDESNSFGLTKTETSAILDAGLNDYDGDEVVEGVSYRVYVLSVHNEIEKSVLSEPSAIFSLERTNLVSTIVDNMAI